MPVITHLMGGLGNQMFQYAAGRSLAIHSGINDLRIFFEDGYNIVVRRYALEPFNIRASLATHEELSRIGPERKLRRRIKMLFGMPIEQHVVREKNDFVFDPAVLAHRGDAYLIGFWQSYRYFESVRSQLMEDLTLKQSSDAYKQTAASIARAATSVSFHIRRTDYLDPKSGYSVLPESYYRKALDLLRKKVPAFDVFVFTDDVAWAKENVGAMIGQSPVTIVSNPALKDHEEMMLMSLCHHNIIANSSFSWWGAWLNDHPNKCVIAPLAWRNDSTAESLKDFIPPTWTLA